MVQRVYRQIKKIDKHASVTIATSKSQVSAIHNQLGNDVSICVEPMRRDTFPAIVLAASYLHDEMSVSLDDSVVVCPVDPYVEDSYYETVKQLGELAGESNLTLMGIEPSYPSEKYGYIIPETKEEVAKVREFLENNSSVVVRPSGTEPKLKVYISISAETMASAGVIEQKITKQMAEYMK